MLLVTIYARDFYFHNREKTPSQIKYFAKIYFIVGYISLLRILGVNTCEFKISHKIN